MFKKGGIEWDTLVKWILVLAVLFIILAFIIYSKEQVIEIIKLAWKKFRVM